MTIKTGKHVDANGKIYLPYLHEWKHKRKCVVSLATPTHTSHSISECGTDTVLVTPKVSPQSDLLGLIQVMIVVFGDEPPVFSRPISTSFPPYQATGPPNNIIKKLLCKKLTSEQRRPELPPSKFEIEPDFITDDFVVTQAVLTHLVVHILPQQVPNTLPSLLRPLLTKTYNSVL
ncbi:hypothetical protein P7K49_022023 [Saguinus oedipus]|uniref:UEV domain-containing protein n=1 Tax=Saguinus oedipus TaxID=9490 RepID=A0ABQ9UV61_SAGOE|nr:hypothetical protein P7K49_022023 [Saguinus oedipus]